jgi:SAM-dependent methyltransferase
VRIDLCLDRCQSNALYDTNRVRAFVCDLTTGQMPEFVEDNSVDVVLLVFVLSAIAPERMHAALGCIYRALKPGGFVIFRDYGRYDMTQMRFVAKQKRKIGDNFYVRGDGTRTFFFSTEYAEQLFTQVGFVKDVCQYDVRELRNRKRLITMFRVWIRSKWFKPVAATTTTTTTTTTDASVDSATTTSATTLPAMN